jgi:hypothetical protein
VLVGPQTGASEWIVLTTARARDRVTFGGGMLALACFEESGSWWFLVGFSDNVSHILVGAHHGCCSLAVTRGLDRAFLMSSTRGRLLVLGGNPLHGSDTLDSRMGSCLWDLSLGQRTGDGEV